MILLMIFLIIPGLGEAAKIDPRQEYARRQRLQQSAQAWFQREVAPVIVGGPNLRTIRSLGVSVKERGTVLPPDLGGPRPGSPVEVLVQISFSGISDEWDRDWGRRQRVVECKISQRLLATSNRFGQPESIRPNQPLRGPLACASGGLGAGEWGRELPGYPWGR